MRGIKEFIIGCAVALLSTCGLMSALADDEEAAFNAGLAAMQRGHYAMAYRAWIDIAQSGNARAKSNIGYLYEQGFGVSQDYGKAMTWYSGAAALNMSSFEDKKEVMPFAVPTLFCRKVNKKNSLVITNHSYFNIIHRPTFITFFN